VQREQRLRLAAHADAGAPRHRVGEFLAVLDEVDELANVLVGDYDEPRRRVRLRAATTKTGDRSGWRFRPSSPSR
jgi:hypothetical protein